MEVRDRKKIKKEAIFKKSGSSPHEKNPTQHDKPSNPTSNPTQKPQETPNKKAPLK
ncbi:hypothetical protein [Brunnivagina elsteri]|uniref:hypothetical protein n=1 Tax=Brunnivagina elsteri TaxID=1247191 RepID=UPI0013043DB6|nr:hypothetical protein [Calothrix elsteri]